MTHFYPLWDRLTRRRLRAIDFALLTLGAAWLAAGLAAMAREGAWLGMSLLAGIAALYVAISWLATREREPVAVPTPLATEFPRRTSC